MPEGTFSHYMQKLKLNKVGPAVGGHRRREWQSKASSDTSNDFDVCVPQDAENLALQLGLQWHEGELAQHRPSAREGSRRTRSAEPAR